MLLAVALADPHPINPRSSTSIVQRRTQVFLLLSLFIVVPAICGRATPSSFGFPAVSRPIASRALDM
ncbi:uncharacterized protein QC764_0105820 [Podospora pseudoanserina]|uniref:Uncharacterized protein n=1 Tax=Podospora pseudoanserina TaxID=2609844 RepID=A0ABR0HLK6_9PEZI|nr:hypothetical protein QC764_0105820 [Podospora pseudoanserina]